MIRRWGALALAIVALIGGATSTLVAQDTPVGEPWRPLPGAIEGDLSDDALRAELLAHKQELCQDLQVVSSVILNTGVLGGFRPLIQDVAGMNIGQLEAELETCTPDGFRQRAMTSSNAELVADVRMVEWLLNIHLVALDQATIATPRLRPVADDGPIGDFLKLHDTLITEMRGALAALANDTATLEEARALGAFWQDVLAPHARAEDEALFPLVRATGDAQLARSADVIAGEHQPIEAGIALYMETLAAVESGRAETSALIPIARELRGSVELHFGREEATLIDPLRAILPSEQFAPVVEAQDAAIGTWLAERGWKPS